MRHPEIPCSAMREFSISSFISAFLGMLIRKPHLFFAISTMVLTHQIDDPIAFHDSFVTSGLNLIFFEEAYFHLCRQMQLYCLKRMKNILGAILLLTLRPIESSHFPSLWLVLRLCARLCQMRKINMFLIATPIVLFLLVQVRDISFSFPLASPATLCTTMPNEKD